VVLDHFGARSLAGFGLEEKPRAVAAAGALIAYVKRVRQDSLALVHRISYLNPAGHLVLDATTVRNLELVRNLRDGRTKDTLLDVIDFTVTAPGGRSALARRLRDAAGIAAPGRRAGPSAPTSSAGSSGNARAPSTSRLAGKIAGRPPRPRRAQESSPPAACPPRSRLALGRSLQGHVRALG
jgi:hypothetical protein